MCVSFDEAIMIGSQYQKWVERVSAVLQYSRRSAR